MGGMVAFCAVAMSWISLLKLALELDLELVDISDDRPSYVRARRRREGVGKEEAAAATRRLAALLLCLLSEAMSRRYL
jgi:hypothetical protein